MKAIYEYRLDQLTEEVMVPKGAEILSVQEQNGNPVIWMLVDTEEGYEARRFQSYHTGVILSDCNLGKFIGTVQLGPIVVHVFEDFFRMKGA